MGHEISRSIEAKNNVTGKHMKLSFIRETRNYLILEDQKGTLFKFRKSDGKLSGTKRNTSLLSIEVKE